MADMKTAYHIVYGAKEMYAADAAFAVRQHPGEWSYEAWSIEDTNRFRRAEYDRALAEAERTGGPKPEEPVDLQLNDQQRTDLDADADARAEAAEIVREDDQKRLDEAEYQRKVQAARDLLASAPPQPAALAPEQADPRAQVPIDGDWQNLSGPKKRSLAMRLGAPNTVTVDEAEARIKEETERRTNKPAPVGPDNPTGPSARTAPTAPAPIADPYAHQPDARPEPDPAAGAPPPNTQPTPSATFENPTPKPAAAPKK